MIDPAHPTEKYSGHGVRSVSEGSDRPAALVQEQSFFDPGAELP